MGNFMSKNNIAPEGMKRVLNKENLQNINDFQLQVSRIYLSLLKEQLALISKSQSICI